MRVLMIAYDNESYITWFPQGLAYLASVARNAGHTVEVYQQDIYHWPESHLTEYLDNNKYDVVEVSVIGGYYQYRKLLKLSNAINASKRRREFKYTLGGHGPASDPHFYLRKTGADVVGIGEGEKTFVELLDAFDEKRSLNSVNGIAYFLNGEYIRTQPRELIQDIDSIPWPAYDLFDINHYALMRDPNIKTTDRMMAVLSGRGCVFSCNFCYRMDKGFRPRSPQGIIDEIEFLKREYNINYIDFSDELLMSSIQRTLTLCQAFIDSELNVRWACNGRLNFARKEVLEKMKEAGCVFINYGIESLDDETLKIMHKALNKKMIIEGIENTLSVGISPGLNIIFGNINEPLSVLEEDVEFLLKYDDHSQMRTIRPVTPYPGTELFQYAIEKGLLKDTEDFYENKHKNSDLLSVNFTKSTDEEIYDALNRANKRLIKEYYRIQKTKSDRVCDDLYINRNEAFRGFRQT